jgi:hypothetical protein
LLEKFGYTTNQPIAPKAITITKLAKPKIIGFLLLVFSAITPGISAGLPGLIGDASACGGTKTSAFG